MSGQLAWFVRCRISVCRSSRSASHLGQGMLVSGAIGGGDAGVQALQGFLGRPAFASVWARIW